MTQDNPLIQIKQALKYAANHKFGDGDVTHMLTSALSSLDKLIAEKEKREYVNSDDLAAFLSVNNHLWKEEAGLAAQELIDNFSIMHKQPPKAGTND